MEIPEYSKSELVEKLREVNRIVSKLNEAVIRLDMARRRIFRVVVDELGERQVMKKIDRYIYEIEETLNELVEKLVDEKIKPYTDKYTGRLVCKENTLVKRLGVVKIKETGSFAIIYTDGLEVWYSEWRATT
jgi:hypothetical protein